MQPPERQLERDIVRYLDGELDEARRRELVERLRRDAAARRLLEQYATVDRLAGEALLERLDRPHGLAVRRPARRRAGIGVLRLLGPAAAVAAVIALAVLLRPTGPDGTNGVVNLPGGKHPGVSAAGMDAFPSRPLEVLLGPPQRYDGSPGLRQVERQVFGVLDEKSNEVYVLEVDRVQTQVQQAEWDF